MIQLPRSVEQNMKPYFRLQAKKIMAILKMRDSFSFLLKLKLCKEEQ